MYAVFSSESQFKLCGGVQGRSPGQLQHPTDVAVDANGDIIVADYGNCWVSIFSPEATFKTKTGAGRLTGPNGVTVDLNGLITVVDSKLLHLHLPAQWQAEFLFKFGSHGEGSGQFNAPTGVAVDSDGNIIVADWGNSCIQVFDSSGSFLSYINTSAELL
ncbi:hypothetical protein HPG69_004315 [Diceros bicornis minor]|uniref:Uncharacterized protein n=1 Tax=Diceros bicornis minor TaxID=77932 RepID=A0A7J7F4N3_DICBM|nr:hypothetical protein HPG69_004315 [Diceros bicornis minor]